MAGMGDDPASAACTLHTAAAPASAACAVKYSTHRCDAPRRPSRSEAGPRAMLKKIKNGEECLAGWENCGARSSRTTGAHLVR